MGSAGLSKEIKIANPLERRLVADVAVAGMSSVVRGRFDIENLATQLVTDAAAITMQQREIEKESLDYQQSQHASRGEFNLSPWESQLINDANFTANTELPSIRLDTNDEDLAQRIGEDVSHFYHPTPPPRNPSGFWQRIEQRYKNEFERQALIAQGRAAANSEVMSESLGHATTNQQNYLDLGYTDSVTQTRAGLIGISLVPAAKSIQLGKQATKFLVENKWGFFGHNDVKNLENSSNFEANNQVTRLKLSSELALKEAGILDSEGRLTTKALQNSFPAMKRGTVLENPTVVKELTKDGSQITDWRKLSTQSIELPSGQRVQVHFYQNRFTGEVNYTHPDFKVKNPVDVFKDVDSPQSVLDQYGFKF